MTWKTTFDGSFGLYDAQDVAINQLGVGPAVALPKPRGKLNGNAEQIMVQANENNTGTVIITQTASSPSGFRLAPGGSQVLPDNSYTVWKLLATQPGCTVTVTYVAGPK